MSPSWLCRLHCDAQCTHACPPKHPRNHPSIQSSTQLARYSLHHKTSNSTHSPTVQSHKHLSTHVTSDAYLMLQNHPHFPPLHPLRVSASCSCPTQPNLSIHGSKCRSVIFFTTGDKCPGIEEVLEPSRRLTWIVFSLLAGRRILYCPISVILITRLPNIFRRKSLFILSRSHPVVW